MKDPSQFYSSRLEENQEKLHNIGRQVATVGFLRLIVFLAGVFLLYHFFGNIPAITLSLIGASAVFILLVARHSDLKYKRDRIRELIRINEVELQVLDRAYLELPTGAEFQDANHFFSRDIDLFGRGSFFQYLNRTALPEGKKHLARLLLSNGIEGIEQKQDAVRELAAMADWRQDFTATATLAKTERSTGSILSWLTAYKPFTTTTTGGWLPKIFSLISLGLTAALVADLLPWVILLLWFLLGLGVTGIYFKRVQHLSAAVTETQDVFHQYYRLLGLLENTTFSSSLLKASRAEIVSKDYKASLVLRKFSRTIDALDQRNSMIFGILINGFLLWDLMQSYRLEQWITAHRAKVREWFRSIEHLDALNSLGNFAFNHPSYIFPEINHQTGVTQARALGHPLLDPVRMTRNDFSISQEEFFIITGANMAGKSTFLRTVSLLILMGNCGLPVCADFCIYSPIKLITSMRTSDSLTDEESYFFSELKRLQFIVEEISRERYFIILDEILKGTNSTDKAIGSRKFIERLVVSKSTGIIATHDLSLCEVSGEFSQVKNYYFDAEIINEELHFDYKLKEGICRNMNASFLLKKMGIVD